MAGIISAYVGPLELTISGTDYTKDFTQMRRVKADCGVDGDSKKFLVSASSFSDPLTTITLISGTGGNLTSNLTEVYVAQTDGGEFYITSEVDTISGSLSAKIDSDISTHAADTTSVHGITDTSDLVLKSGNVNQLSDITSTGANIEDAVTKKHAAGSDTTLGTMTQDIDMDDTYQVVGLQAPAAAGEALRQTTNITEGDLEQLTDGSATTLHTHAYGDMSDLSDDTTPSLGGDLDTGAYTISGTGTIITGDHGTATTPEVVNVVYGTEAPTISGVPEGTIYLQYEV